MIENEFILNFRIDAGDPSPASRRAQDDTALWGHSGERSGDSMNNFQ